MKLSLFGHSFLRCKTLTVDSPLAISGSERLQVEDVNRRVFVPSVEHVINWCQCSKGRGKRRGEAQEKKADTFTPST